MKWNFLSAGLLAGTLCLPAPLPGQDSPADAAAREEREANFKRMNTKVEQIEETLQAQQKKMRTLIDELHSLREEVDRLKTRNESAATQESIKRLAEKIEEVDRKRQADNEKVLAQLKLIAKDLSKPVAAKEPAPPAANAKPDKPATPDTANTPPEKAYAYKIKDGDTLVRIVSDLRAQGYKVTQKQVMDTNPKVNWNRLTIGQTIYIPPPMP